MGNLTSTANTTRVGAFLLLLMAPVANAAVINGSFDDGLTGWTVLSDAPSDQIYAGNPRGGAPRVTYPYPQSTIPVPEVAVIDASPPLFPGSGAHVLQCVNEEGYAVIQWTMPNGVTYDRFGASYSVMQTVHAHAGDVISGWANYYAGEGGPPSQDAVLINGVQVWMANDALVGAFGHFLGWQHWSYTVPADGDFIISLDISSSGNSGASLGYFGDITLSAVPEQAMFLVGAFPILLVGLDAVRRTLMRCTQKGSSA